MQSFMTRPQLWEGGKALSKFANEVDEEGHQCDAKYLDR